MQILSVRILNYLELVNYLIGNNRPLATQQLFWSNMEKPNIVCGALYSGSTTVWFALWGALGLWLDFSDVPQI